MQRILCDQEEHAESITETLLARLDEDICMVVVTFGK